MEVWVYLAPPSESPPHTTLYSEPFRCDYRRWADGVVVAYPRDRWDIDRAEAVLGGATILTGELSCPWATPAAAGDFAAADISAKVLPGRRPTAAAPRRTPGPPPPERAARKSGARA